MERIKDKYGEELKEEIQRMYPKVFSGLGKLEPAHHMEIETDAKPVVNPSRKIPAALREKVKKELDEMEKDGVIIKAEEPTGWGQFIGGGRESRWQAKVMFGSKKSQQSLEERVLSITNFLRDINKTSWCNMFHKTGCQQRTLADTIG